MKVVINTRIGGFSLSTEALIEYCKLKKLDYTIEPAEYSNVSDYVVVDNERLWHWDIPRHDPDLISVVEKLGNKANGISTELKIVDIPDGVEYIICENDCGTEWIAEKHRTWD
jgi:hypothetical protein